MPLDHSPEGINQRRASRAEQPHPAAERACKAMAKAVNVSLVLNEKKKNSVRFDGVGEKPALTSVYLMNHAYEALGKPQKLLVRIEAEA